MSFRPAGEILANVYKISQSLRSFEMTRGYCHFDCFPCHFDRFQCHFDRFQCHFSLSFVISTSGRNLNQFLQDFSVTLFLRNDKGGTVISTVSNVISTVSNVISTSGRNLSHSLQDFSVISTVSNVISPFLLSFRPIPMSFRPTGEILTNFYKISQSLCSFEMTRGVRSFRPFFCHFDLSFVISTVSNVISTSGRNLSHSLQDFSVTSFLRNDKGGTVISPFFLSCQNLIFAVPSVVVATKCPGSSLRRSAQRFPG